MDIYEDTTTELTVVDSTAIDGEITVVDEENEEEGTVISHTIDGKLVVQWQDAEESENHAEIELISIYSPNVTLIKEEEEGELEYVQNPLGEWLTGKIKGGLKQRKAKKAFGKRIKAESHLEKAKKEEAEAIKRAKENPYRRDL
jgi:hypothetical protein